MKNCLILLFVVLSCYNAVVVEGLKGGLRMNDQPAQSMTTERIPCTNNCDAPADPSIVETKEPLKGPFVGKVEFPANSNNLIAEGENVTVAKESHSKMISQHKGFQVDGVQFVQHYNSKKSHPNGGYVGTKYVEWSEPKMKVESTNDKPTTFVPPTVPTGYYSKLKAQAEEHKRSTSIRQLRQDRAKRRMHICEICDSAVETGRVIVKNEAKRGVYNEFGLATFTSVICKNLRDGFPEELPHFECEGLRKHIVSYYDKKYMHEIEGKVERYTADGTVFEKKMPSKTVNAALASALQNCKSLLGIDFCDGTPKSCACNGINPPSSGTPCPCHEKVEEALTSKVVAATEHKTGVTVTHHQEKLACGTCNGKCPCEAPKKVVVHVPVKKSCGCKICPCSSETAPTHTLGDILNATNPKECGTCNGGCPCHGEKPKPAPPVPKCGTCNGGCPCPMLEEKSKCGCDVCPCVNETNVLLPEPICGTCNGACPCQDKPKPPPPVPKCGTCNGLCPCEEKPKPSPPVAKCGTCNGQCPCEEKPKCGTCNGLCPCEEPPKVLVDVVKPQDEENKPKTDDGDYDVVSVVHLKPVTLKEFNEDVFEETVARALNVERSTVDVVLKTVKLCVGICDGGGILVPFKVTSFDEASAAILLRKMKKMNFVTVFKGSSLNVGYGSKFHVKPKISVKGATAEEGKIAGPTGISASEDAATGDEGKTGSSEEEEEDDDDDEDALKSPSRVNKIMKKKAKNATKTDDLTKATPNDSKKRRSAKKKNSNKSAISSTGGATGNEGTTGAATGGATGNKGTTGAATGDATGAAGNGSNDEDTPEELEKIDDSAKTALATGTGGKSDDEKEAKISESKTGGSDSEEADDDEEAEGEALDGDSRSNRKPRGPVITGAKKGNAEDATGSSSDGEDDGSEDSNESNRKTKSLDAKSSGEKDVTSVATTSDDGEDEDDDMDESSDGVAKKITEGESNGGGSETGSETGSATGSKTGSATGSETGSATGSETGSPTESETGSPTESETGSESLSGESEEKLDKLEYKLLNEVTNAEKPAIVKRIRRMREKLKSKESED